MNGETKTQSVLDMEGSERFAPTPWSPRLANGGMEVEVQDARGWHLFTFTNCAGIDERMVIARNLCTAVNAQREDG